MTRGDAAMATRIALARDKDEAMSEQASGRLTVAETASLLQRSTEQVRRYLRDGALPGRRIGGQWFIDRDDAEAFLIQGREVPEFLRRLAASDPDPLADVIGIGGSGGGAIAHGTIDYYRALARARPS
jgi:excisionase family DNA binding protein